MNAGDAETRSRLSVEHSLPLLISALLIVVLLAFSWAAHREVKRSTEVAVAERLQRVTRQLADLFLGGLANRTSLLAAAAADGDVRGTLTDPTGEREGPALRALQRRLLLPGDTTVVVAEIWNADERRVLSTHRDLESPDLDAARALIAAGRETGVQRLGSLYLKGDSVLFWMHAPIEDRGRVVGRLLQRRRISAPGQVQQRIRALVANDATAYLANENGDFWAAYGGSVVRAPHGVRNAVALLEYERDGAGAQVAAHARIAGTPWLVVLEISRQAMRERPTAFLKRMSLIAAVLVAVGAAAAWMLSRHVTRPLAALTSAAEGVSLGDYSRRVAVKRRDEFGHLSETFNVMASRVSESREELQRQIEASRALAAELEDASRAKSDFLAVMSHELRTPLNAIGGYVDLIDLGLRGPVTPAQRTDLERIRRNQHHLLGIINNILSYARIEATQVPYTLERVPVTAILEDVQTLIEPQMREKGIRYDCRSGDATLAVRADRGQAGQIVLNLLSNAVRFTAAGGTVKVRCESDDDMVRVIVADTGIGIPRDKLETIFEPFVQVKTGLTRPADGTGLGLTISRELARGMGGDVVASSVEGRGSTFVLTLRRADANEMVSCVTARRTAESANSPATIRT